MNLNQITLPCSDYRASLDFYLAIGLTLIVNSPPRYARFETPAGTTLSIHRVASEQKSSGVTVYFEVDDVDAEVDRLQARGLQFDSSPADQRWLWREAHLLDPHGNDICLYHAGENRRFPPWRIGGKSDKIDTKKSEEPR